MNRLRSLCQMLKYFVLSAFCWLMLYGPLLAAKAKEVPKKESKGGWTLAYILVMMGIILGMLVVCRSARRRERAKPEEYAEKTEKRLSQAEMLEEETRQKKLAEQEKKQG